MGNIEYDDGPVLIGRTYRNDDKSTLLIIPVDLAKHLQIENSKVSMSLLDDCDGDKHLVITKFYNEIVMD
ncbi:MAG: hypothetical protein M3M88_07930 [Thermoproteota archaeon]|nr:hypothetical protein [Thermoproteota archaeon]